MQIKKEIKYILGCIRRCDQRYRLIEDGDHILVGVSGGKDSLVLLFALYRYRQFTQTRFELEAATIDLGFKPVDGDAIARYCEKLRIPYRLVRTEIGAAVREKGQEESPCSLCARMRRGALTTLARELGCNKIALGHQREDVMETFLLSLFHEGRLHTFAPLTWLDRSDVTQIRPLVYAKEARIKALAAQLELPVQEAQCSVSDATQRRNMKELLAKMEEMQPGLHDRICRAIETPESYGLWDSIHARPQDRPKWWFGEDD